MARLYLNRLSVKRATKGNKYYTVAEIKEFLKERGFAVTGTKTALVKRLRSTKKTTKTKKVTVSKVKSPKVKRAKKVGARKRKEKLAKKVTKKVAKKGTKKVAKKGTRKAPSEHAKEFDLGYVSTGMDGNLWIIFEIKNGVKRWKRYNI